jgi:hypothetical protein
MIACLALTTGLMLISSNVELRPLFDRQVAKIDLSAPPSLAITKSTRAVAGDPGIAIKSSGLTTNVTAPVAITPTAASTPSIGNDFVPLVSTATGHLELNSARSGSATTIRVTKAIYFNGKKAGSLEIMVPENGDLIIEGKELKLILAQPEFKNEAIRMQATW